MRKEKAKSLSEKQKHEKGSTHKGVPQQTDDGELHQIAGGILSAEGAATLSKESAAIDFVRDAFGHLKAIGVDRDGQALLKSANI